MAPLLPDGVSIPADLDEILAGGIANYGSGKQRRDAYVRFLLRFARRAKQVSASGPTDFEDPWWFRSLVREVGTSTDQLQANAVLHLCFPEVFDVVLSSTQRHQLLRTFRDIPDVAAAQDDDHKLIALRSELLVGLPTPVSNLYDEGLQAVWNGKRNPLWEEVIVAMRHDPGSVAPHVESDATWPPLDADLLADVARLRPDGGALSWEASLVEAGARLLAVGTRTRSWSAVAGALGRAMADRPPAVDDVPKATAAADAASELGLRRATRDLAEGLLVGWDWLQETIDALARKRQLILYGPPGTGKTYVAQALARHLTEGGGGHRLLQFHPSYAYEDFVEGYRPRSGENGALAYDLVAGPFKAIAEEARVDPDHPYVLIIDEINRGNLAKVFGELYFLLEYRDE
ncbi:MAG: AAA family ATPase, partial [Solirubrobacteraceae bacterium]